MLLGTIDTSAIKVPPACLEEMKDDKIDTSPHGIPRMPTPATCWLWCDEAWPHIDPTWHKDLFLCLTVQVGMNAISDARYAPSEIRCHAGDFFVIDPMVTHWCQPDPEYGGRFVCLQWEVSRRKAKDLARKIMAEMGGLWAANITDRRYRSWAPNN